MTEGSGPQKHPGGEPAALGPVDLPGSPATGRGTGAERHMLEALVCPVTQGQLQYDAEAQELLSPTAHLAFPIRNGIPIMLAGEARELE